MKYHLPPLLFKLRMIFRSEAGPSSPHVHWPEEAILHPLCTHHSLSVHIWEFASTNVLTFFIFRVWRPLWSHNDPQQEQEVKATEPRDETRQLTGVAVSLVVKDLKHCFYINANKQKRETTGTFCASEKLSPAHPRYPGFGSTCLCIWGFAWTWETLTMEYTQELWAELCPWEVRLW